MLKGALHVHSTYSDGEFTISELRNVFLAEGCSFVCMTDHAEYFDSDKLQAYAEECQAASDGKLCFVTGLEYACDQNMHILGYGARARVEGTEPQSVIRQIDEQRAISVIAHPKNEFFSWIESFEVLPQGIEVWNSKYDGRYAPRPGTFQLLQQLRARRPEMHAFYGLDLHWKKQFRGLLVQIEVQIEGKSPRPEQILTALANGSYRGQKAELTLPSSGILPEDLLEGFSRTHERSYRIKKALKQSKRLLDECGLKIPESLKAQLRRIF